MKLCCSLWGGEDLSIISFLNNKGVVTSVLQAIGSEKWQTHKWSYHVIATNGNTTINQNDHVYDCCLRLDASTNPWNTAISHIPKLPGGITSPMTLGPFTKDIKYPYEVTTDYLDRLFDCSDSNRSTITFISWSLNQIE